MNSNPYSVSSSEVDYMSNENEKAKRQLISILKERQAILFAGAGCSKVAGYPLWGELLDSMSSALTPTLKRPSGIDNMAFADEIKNAIDCEGRIKEYSKYLERAFRPGSGKNHTQFHCALVQLGFSGIVTTNYDSVLETAVGEAFSKNSYFLCHPIDLCLPKPYRVFDFMRKLSPNNDHCHILHIHGFYENSECIILTASDYLKAYGEQKDRILDTIHRKVIWSILVTHPIVFVGFSMDDEFFMKVLEIVQKDFELDHDSVYFSIMGYEDDEDRERILRILKHKGVLPIFYHAPKNPSVLKADHSGLEKLIFELASIVGVQIGEPSLRSIAQKMLER